MVNVIKEPENFDLDIVISGVILLQLKMLTKRKRSSGILFKGRKDSRDQHP
jgi:hypothetical protein